MKIRKMLKSSLLWQSLANYVERFWALLLSVILARLILPHVFGEFAYGVALAQFASLAFRWEIGNLVRADPYFQKEGFEGVWALSRLLVMGELLLVSAAAVICFWISESAVIAGVLLVSGVLTALDKFSMLLRSDLEGDSCFKPNFITKIIAVPVCGSIAIPLAYQGLDICALMSPLAITVIVNWFVYRHYNTRPLIGGRANPVLLKKVLSPGVWNWLNNLCHVLIFRGDKLILGGQGNSEALGQYNRAYNFSPISFMALGALSMGPAVSDVRRLQNSSARLLYFWRRCFVVAVPGLIMGAVWLLFTKQIVLFLFGPNWTDSIPYFKAFAFFGAVQSVYFLANTLLQGSRMYKAQAVIKLSLMSIVVILCLLLTFSPLEIAYLVQGVMLATVMVILVYLSFAARRAGSEGLQPITKERR